MPDSRVYDIIPRTHAKIGIKYVAGRKKVDSLDEVEDHIQELLNEALSTIITEIEIWINIKVPMLTGALRESLVFFLNRSRPPPSAAGEIRGIRLVLGVGAEIFYAKYVNEMTTAQVRHPIDPRAIGFYHDHMVAFGKERFQINVDKARYKFSVGE